MKEGKSVKDAASAVVAERRRGDYSKSRAARIALGKSRAEDFIAGKSAEKLGAYKMSTELLGMSRRDAAERSGVSRMGSKGKRERQARKAAENAAYAAGQERRDRIAAGIKRRNEFAQGDLTKHQRQGLAALRGANDRANRTAVAQFKEDARQRGAVRRVNDRDSAVVAGRRGKAPSDYATALRVFNALKAEGSNTTAVHRRLMRLVKIGRI